MKKVITILFLFTTPAIAQIGGLNLGQTSVVTLPYRMPSPAEQELTEEFAKHPGQHWVCTAMDYACLKGYWETDESPEALDARRDANIQIELEAMRRADKKQ